MKPGREREPVQVCPCQYSRLKTFQVLCNLGRLSMSSFDHTLAELCSSSSEVLKHCPAMQVDSAKLQRLPAWTCPARDFAIPHEALELISKTQGRSKGT